MKSPNEPTPAQQAEFDAKLVAVEHAAEMDRILRQEIEQRRARIQRRLER